MIIFHKAEVQNIQFHAYKIYINTNIGNGIKSILLPLFTLAL